MQFLFKLKCALTVHSNSHPLYVECMQWGGWLLRSVFFQYVYKRHASADKHKEFYYLKTCSCTIARGQETIFKATIYDKRSDCIMSK